MVKILFVDDKQYVRTNEMFFRVIDEGHTVVPCPCGYDAWAVHRDKRYDVYIIDASENIPVRGQDTLLEALQNLKPGARFIATTAQPGAREILLGEGFEEVLEKPISTRDIYSILKDGGFLE